MVAVVEEEEANVDEVDGAVDGDFIQGEVEVEREAEVASKVTTTTEIPTMATRTMRRAVSAVSPRSDSL